GIQLGPWGGRGLIEEVEKAGQRSERAVVRLLLGEQAQHRLGTDQANRQAIRVLPGSAMRVDDLDAGDGVQLAAPLVEQDLDVAGGPDPAAEAGLRAPDALRDRSPPPAVGRVQMEDAVRLRIAERPEHDRLGLVRASHDSSLVSGQAAKDERE